jgi:hypothetical protein
MEKTKNTRKIFVGKRAWNKRKKNFDLFGKDTSNAAERTEPAGSSCA